MTQYPPTTTMTLAEFESIYGKAPRERSPHYKVVCDDCGFCCSSCPVNVEHEPFYILVTWVCHNCRIRQIMQEKTTATSSKR